jgi:hypothetical protein
VWLAVGHRCESAEGLLDEQGDEGQERHEEAEAREVVAANIHDIGAIDANQRDEVERLRGDDRR